MKLITGPHDTDDIWEGHWDKGQG